MTRNLEPPRASKRATIRSIFQKVSVCIAGCQPINGLISHYQAGRLFSRFVGPPSISFTSSGRYHPGVLHDTLYFDIRKSATSRSDSEEKGRRSSSKLEKQNENQGTSLPFYEMERLTEGDRNGMFLADEDIARGEILASGSNISITALSLEDLSSISTNVSYFYIKNELGLSEEAMWKITYEAGSALGMTTNTIRRKVEVLRDTMSLSDAEIISVLERHPTILHLSADKNISPTILFLLRMLELGRDDLRRLFVSEPSILSYTTANLNSKINFFVRIMGYSIGECRKVLLAEPKLLRVSVRTGLVPRMRFLVRDMEIPMRNLRAIVKKHPRILLYSLDDNLIPKLIFYLIMTLHMELDQVQKLLVTYPTILEYNLDRHILPITEFFVKDLSYQPAEFRSILLKFPRLMTHSLRKIKHLVGYLRFELGLTGSQVKRVLYQAPQIIGLNTDVSLKAKVEFLRDSLNLSDHELRRVVSGMPTLLVLSIDGNLRPKAEYLRNCFDGNEKDLRETILRLPTLLGYSLDKRIQPRMTAILQSELKAGSITVGIPMKEDKFDAWLVGRKREMKQGLARAEGKALPAIPDLSGRIVHWTRDP